MKEIELSEEVYNKLGEYRRRLSEMLGRKVTLQHALRTLTDKYYGGCNAKQGDI